MIVRVCCSVTAVLLCLSVFLSAIDADGRVIAKGTGKDKGVLPAGKPGVCPINNLFVVCVVRKDNCSYDGNCPGNQKCCSRGCGRQCVAPYKDNVKPGVCPKHNVGDATLGVCAEMCSCDVDCPNDRKCCSNGCGHQCMAPYKAKKPGVCPSASRRYCLRSENLCSQDSTCPGDQKCCNDGCGLRCLPPYREKPGVCLRNTLRYCKKSENLCYQDGNCPGDQKCCTDGCGSQCVPPYKEKPGMCPSNNLGVGVCVEMCSQDSNCPNDQKCCSNGCGRQCVAPYKVRPKSQP